VLEATIVAASTVVKRRIATFLQVHLINPRVRRGAGEPGSSSALLETRGRKSGLPRQIPVLDGLQGNVFWIAAYHGHSAACVKNLEADPRVRIKVRGSWRTGKATLLPDDNTLKRVGSIDPHIAAQARRMGTDLLTIRIDLDS
jgi:deazaflavin-dependent oxidoreductase (nitroreductase family)